MVFPCYLNKLFIFKKVSTWNMRQVTCMLQCDRNNLHIYRTVCETKIKFPAGSWAQALRGGGGPNGEGDSGGGW